MARTSSNESGSIGWLIKFAGWLFIWALVIWWLTSVLDIKIDGIFSASEDDLFELCHSDLSSSANPLLVPEKVWGIELLRSHLDNSIVASSHSSADTMVCSLFTDKTETIECGPYDIIGNETFSRGSMLVKLINIDKELIIAQEEIWGPELYCPFSFDLVNTTKHPGGQADIEDVAALVTQLYWDERR